MANAEVLFKCWGYFLIMMYRSYNECGGKFSKCLGNIMKAAEVSFIKVEEIW
jgi:hypothetical protein